MRAANRLDSSWKGWSVAMPTMVLLFLAVAPAAAQWPQWGGPNRNFACDAQNLASQWPDAGPRTIWTRPLGEGYSAITVDDGRLYTLYRNGDDEFVACLDAATGKTHWEHKYVAPVPEGMDPQFGKGPNATPSIAGGKIFTLGVSGIVHALDKSTGKVVWTHDLGKEYSAKTPYFGYSASPLVHKDRLIVCAGGPESSVLAFKLDDGSLLWKKYDFGGQEKGDIYSSPIPINVDGEDQIVLLVGREVFGFDPATGERKWTHPHVNQWNTNICTPVWGEDKVLYVSAGGEAGSRGLKLTREGSSTVAQEIWSTRKMAIGQGNAVRAGSMVYGSSGDAPAFITAVHVADGKVAWRERGFARASMLHADGKLIILDEDGNLALATPTPEALTVNTKIQLLKKPSWTVPTLVGKTLYVRDKETIMALDLGKS